MTATPTAEDQGTVEDVTVRVCGAPSRYVILTEEPFSEDRWCFHCRGRHDFLWRVRGISDEDWTRITRGPHPEALMNQEPYPSVECSNCGTRDGDVFPGQVRDYYGEHED